MDYKTYCGRCGAGLLTVFKLAIACQETDSAGGVHSTTDFTVELCGGCTQTAKEALRGFDFKIPR
ncbi:MAG: hypothetical protein JWN63_2289 [Candidatus Acidoferrum typicum]|nr:hypothetical protein [Candidatus Acidoferrum typicum]